MKPQTKGQNRMRTFKTKIEIAGATSTKEDTVARWLARPDAPKKGKDGWDRKQRKLALECQILEEKLTAEKRTNEVEAHKLVAVDEAAACVIRWGSEMATAIRVWRESEMAKRPEHAVAVGQLADKLTLAIRDGVDFG